MLRLYTSRWVWEIPVARQAILRDYKELKVVGSQRWISQEMHGKDCIVDLAGALSKGSQQYLGID